ncbi:response regulator transcription factor [Rhodovulum sp. FJ3]|uniref:response regulator transcription factor n=1 Tax=Rhodovulum sp. FJ3 TaxID=3079053 RepID=UPI0026B0D57A|nr:response regulator transcription factor [Rhodovulum sp. FJ3]MDV4167270.1 response regulator transcription factor [Rhodovulum sp. FJ3]MEC8630222.1 response regulator transcription factor [Pseudomonadota bacterium]
MDQTTPAKTLGTALVIDDHPLFCDALALTLKSIVPSGEIRTADRLEAALEDLQNATRPDVILLDLNLPDVNGLEGLMRLKAIAPRVPVIVVSSMADNRMISNTLKAGASGFVPKHSQRTVFRDAFEKISRGEVYTPEGYIGTHGGGAEAPGDDALTRLSSLTNQQARILQLICEGKLNKQIAYDLSIAETTVKAHVTAIMRKLGVQSRTQAVLVAQEASFASAAPRGH